MSIRTLAGLVCAGLVFVCGPGITHDLNAQAARPNIVVRGNLTRRIDRLAAEGIRLTNFNVEFPAWCRAPRC